MNSLFDQLVQSAFVSVSELPMNVVENEDGYVVRARVPGVAKKDISVDIHGNYLKVTVHSSDSQNESGPERALMTEFNALQKVERVLQFRNGLDADSAQLNLENGILTIKVSSPLQKNRRTLTLE